MDLSIGSYCFRLPQFLLLGLLQNKLKWVEGADATLVASNNYSPAGGLALSLMASYTCLYTSSNQKWESDQCSTILQSLHNHQVLCEFYLLGADSTGTNQNQL